MTKFNIFYNPDYYNLSDSKLISIVNYVYNTSDGSDIVKACRISESNINRSPISHLKVLFCGRQELINLLKQAIDSKLLYIKWDKDLLLYCISEYPKLWMAFMERFKDFKDESI